MSTYRLDRLFAPRSVALVGASPRPGSLGRTVLQKLREAAFPGPLWLVNPRHAEIDGERTFPDLAALPAVPDVVVVTAPAPAVPGIVEEAGARGIAAAVVISGGLGHGPGSLGEAARLAARRHGLRLVGPNGLGVIVPPAHFNASFATRMPAAGDLALISQSGAVAAGLAEWATKRSVGFSAIVSVGDAVDVDFGDLLDFFALDPATRTILLYIEAITDAPKFMSAARAAARVKPVVVVKSGRHESGARAAATHTGALAGSDAVYETAFRRAGLLRVLDLDELFAATESLGRLKPFPGRRLAIMTNGGGLGVLAVDRLTDLGGTLAELSPATRTALDARLPGAWSKGNPVDIVGDADADRYAATLEALMADAANDAVLVMNVPTALAPAAEAAQAVASVVEKERRRRFPPKPVFAVWIGEDDAAGEAFERASVPHYASEADAVRGFMHLVRYREARDLMMQTPPSIPEDFRPDTARARAVVDAALQEGRTWLDPVAIDRLLCAYDIPCVPVRLATDADGAAVAAAEFLDAGSSVVVKLLSPDITHKSDVGGVRLDLSSADAVREAAAGILARATTQRPGARITGVTVHPMITRRHARELIAGVADDPTFGPVIVFGRGGTAVEVINDKSLALPPLDLHLARILIGRTRVARILAAYRDVPAADTGAVALTLVKLAQLVADIPEIRELDLNPLIAGPEGVIALDARVAVAPLTGPHRGRGHPRFSIRPYPKDLERDIVLPDGRAVFVRPVRPEDEGLFRTFFAAVSEEDLRLRFFALVREPSHAFLARLIQLDYARAMALVALDKTTGAMIGVVRLHVDANFSVGEYGILVRSDLKGHGLGWVLMQLIIDHARAEKLGSIEGQVLRENTTMLEMCRQLGFEVTGEPGSPDICRVRLPVGAV